MPYDCNCHGINFQTEFQDAAEASERINEAIDFAFETVDRPRPAPENLREELLANGGQAYEIMYTKLLDRRPGCMRVCTNTLLYILDKAGTALTDEDFKGLRGKQPTDDIEKAADERRQIKINQL